VTIDYLFLQTFNYILLDLNLNKTNSNASIAASFIGQAVILVIMHDDIFKTDNVFIDNVIIFLTSHEQIIFGIKTGLLILTISLGEINGKRWKLPTNILHGKMWKLQQTFYMEKRGNYQQTFYNTLLSI
jgi:hypothetical protein